MEEIFMLSRVNNLMILRPRPVLDLLGVDHTTAHSITGMFGNIYWTVIDAL